MDKKSMTALVSAFSRWHHSTQNNIKIFDDFLADKILTEEEKQQIGFNMSNGIGFFNPTFKGTKEEALRWIVDNQLSPTPLGRAAWAENALETAVKIGATQYLVIAAGYDTFAYRQPTWAIKLQIFEFDLLSMIEDKQKRVQNISEKRPNNLTYVAIDLAKELFSEKLCSCKNYNKNELSFCSLLGISYYLSKEHFKSLIQNIANSVLNGSTIVFDYPDQFTYTDQAGERAKKQSMMASGAKETMLASYSYDEISELLADCGFLIYEHLTPNEITKQFFNNYNIANTDRLITAFDNVNYCLAVKN